jgi:hypothetical protein
MQCLVCKKEIEAECRSCFGRLRATLKELPQLQFEAGFYLEPSRTGSGAVSAERSIGINVNALDFSMGRHYQARQGLDTACASKEGADD